MTAPAASGGTASSDYGDTITPTLPAHSAGELLVAYGGWNGPAVTASATAGWTQLFADNPTPSHWFYWKIAVGSSEALSVVGNDPELWSAVTGKITGFDTSGPFTTAVHNGLASTTDPIVPSITPPNTADRLWLHGFLHNANSPAGTVTAPSGHTAIATSPADYRTSAFGYKTHLVDTATGTATWTYATSNDWRSFSVLVNPTPPGGGGSIAAIAAHHKAQD